MENSESPKSESPKITAVSTARGKKIHATPYSTYTFCGQMVAFSYDEPAADLVDCLSCRKAAGLE